MTLLLLTSLRLQSISPLSVRLASQPGQGGPPQPPGRDNEADYLRQQVGEPQDLGLFIQGATRTDAELRAFGP